MCTYFITPIAKWLCDTPLVILTLKFHDLHPFLIYTSTPSVYAHPIFNCVVVLRMRLLYYILQSTLLVGSVTLTASSCTCSQYQYL